MCSPWRVTGQGCEQPQAVCLSSHPTEPAHPSSPLSGTRKDGWHLQITGQRGEARAICCWLGTSTEQRGNESRALWLSPQGSWSTHQSPKTAHTCACVRVSSQPPKPGYVEYPVAKGYQTVPIPFWKLHSFYFSKLKIIFKFSFWCCICQWQNIAAP